MSRDAITTRPKEGEVWRTSQGARRFVRHVDEDGYAVTYSRPSDGHREWCSVLMGDWLVWVEATGATRVRKAGTTATKDWGYAADAR